MGELQNLQSACHLTEKNYLQQFQLVWTFLKGRGKLCHLISTRPKPEDPKFQSWDEEDSMIMSWLWNSMILEISRTCIFLTTAKEIWEAIPQAYSKVWDSTQNFEIKVKISTTKQRTKSVTKYANIMKILWLESSEDVIMLKKRWKKTNFWISYWAQWGVRSSASPSSRKKETSIHEWSHLHHLWWKKLERCDARTIFYWWFCYGCWKPNKFNPNLVGKTGHSNG